MKPILYKFVTTMIILVIVTTAIISGSTHASDPLSKKLARVTNLQPEILDMAIKAQKKAIAKNQIQDLKTLTIIDYSRPSTQKRLWVLDLSNAKVLFHTLVSHGKGTGTNVAKVFSDKPGSHQSSLGVFKTGAIYQGSHGQSLKLHGLEKGFNANAYNRGIVIHAANYVSPAFARQQGRLGLSHGCPALSNQETTPIINKIKNGSLVFAYYPDQNWLNRSHYLQ